MESVVQLVSAINGLKIDVLGARDAAELREGNSGMTWEQKLVTSKFSGANIKDGKLYDNQDEEESPSPASEIDRARARMASREAEESQEQKRAIAAKKAAMLLNQKIENFTSETKEHAVANNADNSVGADKAAQTNDSVGLEEEEKELDRPRSRGRPKKVN